MSKKEFLVGMLLSLAILLAGLAAEEYFLARFHTIPTIKTPASSLDGAYEERYDREFERAHEQKEEEAAELRFKIKIPE